MKLILRNVVTTSKKTYDIGIEHTVTGAELEILKNFADIDAMWRARLTLDGLQDYTEIDIEMLKNTSPE